MAVGWVRATKEQRENPYFRQCTDCALSGRYLEPGLYIVTAGSGMQWFGCEEHALRPHQFHTDELDAAQQAALALGAKLFRVQDCEATLKKIEEEVLAEDAARRLGG